MTFIVCDFLDSTCFGGEGDYLEIRKEEYRLLAFLGIFILFLVILL